MENMGSNPGSTLTGWWNLEPLTFFLPEWEKSDLCVLWSVVVMVVMMIVAKIMFTEFLLCIKLSSKLNLIHALSYLISIEVYGNSLDPFFW